MKTTEDWLSESENFINLESYENLGDTFIRFDEMSPIEQWRRIDKMLKEEGLKIIDSNLNLNKREMTELEKQQKLLEEKGREYQEQREIVEKLKIEQQLPDIIAKYEGKYFRERNSYGCGSDEPDWYIYYIVREITSLDFCKAISIQYTSDNRFEIQEERLLPLSLCEHEITKEDFLSTIVSFEKHIEDIFNICKP